MRGEYQVKIKNRDAAFDFTLHRNITVVNGDSATGKTTLCKMVSQYMEKGKESGITVSCERPLILLASNSWEHTLSMTHESIVFVDEMKFLRSADFAKAVKASDNYYVLFTRDPLHELPYSVDEIYEITSKGKKHSFKPRYKQHKGHVYIKSTHRYGCLMTEDSQSGLDFYKAFFAGRNIQCLSAHGRLNIGNELAKLQDDYVLVIADGAAFGSSMNSVEELHKTHDGFFELCLPESFEWLILKSGLIDKMNPEIPAILNNPSAYIDSREYFSWENFFETLLIHSSENSPEKADYSKKELVDFYVKPVNLEKIAAEIKTALDKHQ